ncbi:hypothetical protein [Selenomonas sp. AE3005]|uniref:hypothetical protein n=1 Tax=Selenomonas sp. AE3005 TaxID=1485543 RepID=UPI0004896A4D|nr:hypothetical protein [Selenomonas sp. AE3005]
MVKEYTKEEFEMEFQKNADKLKCKCDNYIRLAAAIAFLCEKKDNFFLDWNLHMYSTQSADDEQMLSNPQVGIRDICRSLKRRDDNPFKESDLPRYISLEDDLSDYVIIWLKTLANDYIVKSIADNKCIKVLNDYYMKNAVSINRHEYTQDGWIKEIIFELNFDENWPLFSQPYHGIASHILDETIMNMNSLKLDNLQSYSSNTAVNNVIEQNSTIITEFMRDYDSFVHDKSFKPRSEYYICARPRLSDYVDYCKDDDIIPDYFETLKAY